MNVFRRHYFLLVMNKYRPFCFVYTPNNKFIMNTYEKKILIYKNNDANDKEVFKKLPQIHKEEIT